MGPQEDSMDVDTQPLPVEEGFLDFDAPDWKPIDVRVERPHPVAVLMELMRAVEDERKGLH